MRFKIALIHLFNQDIENLAYDNVLLFFLGLNTYAITRPQILAIMPNTRVPFVKVQMCNPVGFTNRQASVPPTN